MDAERRRRFKEWFASVYGEKEDARTRFMTDSAGNGALPLSKGRVTQLFDETEPFGERAAKSLGERFGLGADYFLHDRPGRAKTMGDLNGYEGQLVTLFRQLGADDQQAAIRGLISKVAPPEAPPAPPAPPPSAGVPQIGDQRPMRVLSGGIKGRAGKKAAEKRTKGK